MSIVRAPKKVPAAILAILLGQFGIHKFFLGYPRAGLTMLIVTIVGWALSCTGIGALAPVVMGVIGLAEGIIYLVKPDYEFERDYVYGRREWF